jgi:HAD superfamily phosphatase
MAKRFRQMEKMDILIFDMDGVLIDVSQSYRKTIQQTIHIYLQDCLGMRANLVSHEEISLFKTAGGFNNDWDLTAGFLLYLLSVSKIPPLPRQKKLSSLDEIVLHLRLHLSNFYQRRPLCLKRAHFSPFLERVRASGGGLRGVRSVLSGLWDGWVYRSGDLDQENLVKRIFQEVYLGEKFASHYHLQPLFYRLKGLYLREKLWVGKEILLSLRKKVRLAIASGRPRFEAELALKRFNLLRYFDSIVTLDECEKEEARLLMVSKKRVKLTKPHPYSILKAIEKIGLPNPRCGYIGDTVDDMTAIRSAKKYVNIAAIGFLASRINRKKIKKSLLQAGADFLIEKPQHLIDLIS